MARKAKTTRAGGTTIVTMPAPSAPVRRRRSSSPARRRSGGGGRRRRSSGRSSGSGSLRNRMIGMAVGGFAVGFIEKTFPNLPAIPLIGKKGAIALGAYLFAGKHPIVADVGLAAASISGYQLGSVGTISGDVDGVAAQI
jgi:hypothetical protein